MRIKPVTEEHISKTHSVHFWLNLPMDWMNFGNVLFNCPAVAKCRHIHCYSPNVGIILLLTLMMSLVSVLCTSHGNRCNCSEMLRLWLKSALLKCCYAAVMFFDACTLPYICANSLRKRQRVTLFGSAYSDWVTLSDSKQTRSSWYMASEVWLLS